MYANANEREQRIVEAVIRYIGQREGQVVSSIVKPDNTNRSTKDVDGTAQIGPIRVAVEHTRVESSPGVLEDYARLIRVLCPLQEELRLRLPAGLHFTLHVKSFAIPTGIDWIKLREAVGVWILNTAPGLEHPGLSGMFAVRSEARSRAKIIGIDFELWRDRDESGGLTIGRLVDEPDIASSMSKALEMKCQKLSLYARQGHRTVLVLEMADHVTNLHSTAHAFETAAKETEQPLPDEVFVVDAWGVSQWWLISCKVPPSDQPRELVSIDPVALSFQRYQ